MVYSNTYFQNKGLPTQAVRRASSAPNSKPREPEQSGPGVRQRVTQPLVDQSKPLPFRSFFRVSAAELAVDAGLDPSAFCTRARNYTHPHTRVHNYTQHAHKHTAITPNTHTSTHALTQACTHTHSQAYTHAHSRTHSPNQLHAHARTQLKRLQKLLLT
jgi:hypothetical protein